jgi:PAS domain S-box-containing protein
MSQEATGWQSDFLNRLAGDVENGDLSLCQDDDTAGILKQIAHHLDVKGVLDFQEIGDHLYDGVYIADGQGKTLYVNKAYLRITGLETEDVVGKNVQDLVAAGVYRNAVTPEVIRLRRQVNAVGESTRNHAKMLITGNPIFDSDGNIKLVAVIQREMTDLLQMQIDLDATQQKMKAVEAGRIRGKQEIEHLRKQIMSKNLIGDSPEISAVLDLIRRVADFDVTVLIQGETGVGKEVVANEIHLAGPRKAQPFIKVNCAAIPPTLLEAELFGYVKGAFTGAAPAGKMGLFELADKGSLLLDEIGDMSFDLQCKLLRFLQEKEIVRVGGGRPIRLDVRIIAATHRDLRDLVRTGRFREDLFYRLSVYPIHIPPLRRRPDDIEALTRHFLVLYNGKYRKAVRIDRDGFDVMVGYAWPGNVRELQNVVERLVLVSDVEAVIGRDQMMVLLNFVGDPVTPLPLEKGLRAIVDEVERRAIADALKRCGSTRKAAALLKLDQSTIVKKTQRLGILRCDEKNHRPDDGIHRSGAVHDDDERTTLEPERDAVISG